MTRLLAAAFLLAASATTARADAKDPRWQIAFFSYLSEGDYGTDIDSRFVYSPLTLRWISRRGDVTLVVPYLDVTSDATVLVFRGVPQPPSRTGTSPSRPLARGEVRPTPQPMATPTAVRHRETTRERGLGDVALVGRYFLADSRGGWPAVDLSVRLDLPTGDQSRGLGLGRLTPEVGLQLSKTLGGSFVWLTEASYTFVSGVAVRDSWEYSMGLGCYPVRSLLLSVSFEEWRPIAPGAANGRDLLAAATLKVGPQLRLYVSGQFKLSDSAPDYTAGAGFGVRFWR